MTFPQLPTPSPDEIRAARKKAGLTQTQAAQLIGNAGDKSYRTWQRFEAPADNPDHRAIHPRMWEMFLLLTDQHPIYRLTKRRQR